MIATGALPLVLWLSPNFPVGAFAYSHGLEWACESGDVRDAADLADWLGTLLRQGAPRNDAILLSEAFRATARRDGGALREIGELALALATSGERRLETVAQGNAFRLAVANTWPCAALDLIGPALAPDIAYPVALGAAAAGHDLPLDATLDLFVLGFVQNGVSAALRLGVVGQTDGQKVLAALLPAVPEVARACQDAGLDDLGTSAFRGDLASIRHETQYSRLFRS